MKNKFITCMGILTVGALCFTSNAFAVSADAVVSENIKEADGISGQDTNIGAGVKTGHIQDGAVTDAKISDVSMGKVGGLQVALDSKADNVTVDALSSTVATKAEQSTVDALSGTVAAKADQSAVDTLSSAVPTKADQSAVDTLSVTVATKADQSAVDASLAGKSDVSHEHLYGNMTVVAISGGEYTSPVDAMNDISSWCGVPSSTNPCLIKVMPGTYYLGTGNLPLTSNVSIEGSGAAVTKIYSTSSISTIGNGDTIFSNVSLTGLTIKNSAAIACGVYIGNDSSLSISDSAIIATSYSGTSLAVSVNQSATLDMNDSTIQSSSSASTAYGIRTWDHGRISVSDVAIDVSSTGTSGGAYGISTYSNLYSQNNLIDLNSVNVTANVNHTQGEASGISLMGDNVSNGKATLTNVKATASGGSSAKAIDTTGPYIITMNGVTGVASGGLYNYGIYSASYGSSEHFVEITSSSFAGDTSSVKNVGNIHPDTVTIANTMLDGPILNDGAGILKCLGTLDANFDPIACM